MALTQEQIEQARGKSGLSALPVQKSSSSDFWSALSKRKTESFREDAVQDIKGISSGVGERLEERADKFSQQKTLMGKFAQGAGFAGDVFGEAALGIGKAVLPQKAEDFISDKFQSGVEGAVEKTPESIKQGLSFLNDLKKKNPIISESLDAVINSAMLGAEITGTGAVASTAKKIAPKVVSTGKKTFEAGKEATPKVIQAGRELKNKIKKPVNVELRIADEAVDIASPASSIKSTKDAAREGRLFTKGILKNVKETPTKRTQIISSSIEHLIEDGRISARNLPFENVSEISTEVHRINSGVKNLIGDKKIPFNTQTLRKKLLETKKDSEIIFTTDPTLERTYDSLIEAFIKDVDKKDTLGLFLARQDFDKLPAVKKLLESEKLGESLRKEAILSIRRAVNKLVAEQLDVSSRSVIMKKLQPNEAKSIMDRARKFDDIDEFVSKERHLLEDKITEETYRAERRRIERSLKKGETFDDAIKKEGFPIDIDSDLEDIWQMSHSNIDISTGKLMSDLLKQETDMLEIINNLSEKSKKMGDTNALQRLDPKTKKLLKQAGIIIGAGTVGGLAF